MDKIGIYIIIFGFITYILFTIILNDFISLSDILKKYFEVFKNPKNLFKLYIPTLIISIGVSLTFQTNIELVETLLVILGLIITALFSLQAYINTISIRRENVEKVVLETNHIINFNLMCNIFLIIILLFVQIVYNSNVFIKLKNWRYYICIKNMYGTIIYFGIFSILNNIFVLLKRFNRLYVYDNKYNNHDK